MKNARELIFEQYNPNIAKTHASKSRPSQSLENQQLPVDDKNQSGFRKKDTLDSKVIYACKMCRLHHKRCSGERPCKRCIDKNYTCENIVRTNTKKTTKESPPPRNLSPSQQQSNYDKMFEVMREEHARLEGAQRTRSPSLDREDENRKKKIKIEENNVQRKGSIDFILN